PGVWLAGPADPVGRPDVAGRVARLQGVRTEGSLQVDSRGVVAPGRSAGQCQRARLWGANQLPLSLVAVALTFLARGIPGSEGSFHFFFSQRKGKLMTKVEKRAQVLLGNACLGRGQLESALAGFKAAEEVLTEVSGSGMG